MAKRKKTKDTEGQKPKTEEPEGQDRETNKMREAPMALSPENLEVIRRMVDTAESSLHGIKRMLFSSVMESKARALPGQVVDGKIVEGVFDGENMIGADSKHYPVPPNYASKSKLVSGDKLKLTIAPDGTFIYKQIGPVERDKKIGVLEEDNGRYKVLTDGKYYNVLLASVTYFKAKPGDKLTIVVPKDQETDWAAVENLIGSAS